MANIALVTDSTADLTAEMKKKFEVHVIPLKVNFGKQAYFDGELASEDFYQKLSSVRELPQSSQPSPGDFIALYEKLLNQYEEIISIHLSTALSGTVNAARLAAETLQNKIHVVDSKNISAGIALMVVEAARLIQEDIAIPTILEKLQLVRANIETLFTLNTLEYLQKGGRIGRVSSLLGSLLNIKPVVRVDTDGIYTPVGKARSQNAALDQIIRQIQHLASGRKIKSIAVAHGAAVEAANRLKTKLENVFETKVSYFTHVSSVIGVHTGPGTVGVAVLFEN
ncbi:MAG TPA: DegV family protein [Firmicutes bacterium]|nr:DegV family protein [Bacillota bacterium]